MNELDVAVMTSVSRGVGLPASPLPAATTRNVFAATWMLNAPEPASLVPSDGPAVKELANAS